MASPGKNEEAGRAVQLVRATVRGAEYRTVGAVDEDRRLGEKGRECRCEAFRSRGARRSWRGRHDARAAERPTVGFALQRDGARVRVEERRNRAPRRTARTRQLLRLECRD